MQGREPTYLESKLHKMLSLVESFLEDHPSQDPMAVLVAQVLCDDADECDDPQQCLDTEPLLKAGRAYFALLTENDRLPPGEQLTNEELGLPRALLLDFFLGRSDIQHRAQEVLGLIERKFSERAFQQATILLQLFETDQSTRIQNERKLFYEDMIQRLGVRRRHPLGPNETAAIREHFSDIAASLKADGAFEDGTGEAEKSLGDLFGEGIETSLAAPEPTIDKPVPEVRRGFIAAKTEPGFHAAALDEATSQAPTLDPDSDALMPLSRSLDWLSNGHQINFCLQLRHPTAARRWARLEEVAKDNDSTALSAAVPPLRWRAVSDNPDLPLMEQLGRHLSTKAIREYVRTTTKACYFILLAVGDTGLETYLDTYFGWLSDVLGINGTVFIDRLHRESTLGEQTLQETLDAIFDDHFAEPMAEMPFSFTQEQLLSAVESFLDQLVEADVSEIAPGYFNLGGFILDHLLKVPYPNLEFPFRIHRIV